MRVIEDLMAKAIPASTRLKRLDGSQAVKEFTYSFDVLAPELSWAPSYCAGVYNCGRVVVRPDPALPEESLVTVLHELAHAWFDHGGEGEITLRGSQEDFLQEAQAEAVALICFEYLLGRKASQEYYEFQVNRLDADGLHRLGLSIPDLAEAADAIIEALDA